MKCALSDDVDDDDDDNGGDDDVPPSTQFQQPKHDVVVGSVEVDVVFVGHQPGRAGPTTAASKSTACIGNEAEGWRPKARRCDNLHFPPAGPWPTPYGTTIPS